MTDTAIDIDAEPDTAKDTAMGKCSQGLTQTQVQAQAQAQGAQVQVQAQAYLAHSC